MNFYKHHLGDYAKKTGHLTLAEHGAYALMLHTYYGTEKPLPIGPALYRLLRATTKQERDAVDSVASQFWTATDAGLVNDRADEEIERAQSQREINRETGKRGGRPPKQKEPIQTTEPETESVIESEPINNPIQTPDSRLQNKTPNTGATPDPDADPPGSLTWDAWQAIAAAHPPGSYTRRAQAMGERNARQLVEQGRATPAQLLQAATDYARQCAAEKREARYIRSPETFFDATLVPGHWEGPFLASVTPQEAAAAARAASTAAAWQRITAHADAIRCPLPVREHEPVEAYEGRVKAWERDQAMAAATFTPGRRLGIKALADSLQPMTATTAGNR